MAKKEGHRIGFVAAIRMSDVMGTISFSVANFSVTDVRSVVLTPADIGVFPVRLMGRAVYALELGSSTDDDDRGSQLWELWEDYLEIRANLSRVSQRVRAMHPSGEPYPLGRERELLSMEEMQYRYRSLVAGYRYQLLNFETKAEELDRSRIVWEARQRFIEAASWVELKG